MHEALRMQEIVRKINIARHTLLTVQPDRTNFHNLKIGRTYWTVGEFDFEAEGTKLLVVCEKQQTIQPKKLTAITSKKPATYCSCFLLIFPKHIISIVGSSMVSFSVRRISADFVSA